MICVAPAAPAQLTRILHAELVQNRRATHARPARCPAQAVRAVGLEAGQVEKAQRPALIDQDPIRGAPQHVPIEVPHAEVAARVFQNGGREAGRGELEEARQPRAVLRTIAASASIE
jgi:hypothetical protein